MESSRERRPIAAPTLSTPNESGTSYPAVHSTYTKALGYFNCVTNIVVIIFEGYIAALPESRCCHCTSVNLVTVIRMIGLHDSRQPPLLGHAYRIAQGWGMHDNGAMDVFFWLFIPIHRLKI